MTIELDAGAIPPDGPRASGAPDALHRAEADAPRHGTHDAPLASAPRDRGAAFVFTGTGAGYFRIWIVNLLLTVVTVGIYSAWAKVRRLRYFYGNTLVDGSPFEFHGRPIALLKGRVVGLVLLAGYTQAPKVSFALWLAVVAGLVALLPWLLWKSLRFRFANSSYRGIRFGFDGTLAQAYLTFIPLMVMVLTPSLLAVLLGHAANDARSLRAAGAFALIGTATLLFAPWFYFRLRAYQHRHARLGATPFAFEARVRSAYWLAIKIALLMIGFGLIAGACAAAFGMVASFSHVGAGKPPALASIIAAVGIAYLIMLSGLSQPIAMIQNFVWNHSALGGAPFASDVRRSKLWRILFVNLVLTVATAGLFWPFAVVRSARYRIGSLSWSGDAGAVAAGANDLRVGASGEETAELFGLDIAL